MKRNNKTRKLTALDIENPSGTTKQCRKQYFSHIFNRLSIVDWTLFRTQATPFSIQFSNNRKSINFNAQISIFFPFCHHKTYPNLLQNPTTNKRIYIYALKILAHTRPKWKGQNSPYEDHQTYQSRQFSAFWMLAFNPSSYSRISR